MKTFIVKESEFPIGNELYQPSYDLVNVNNPSEFYIIEPGGFKLGEVVDEDQFTLEKRHYTDGEHHVHGSFAVRKAKPAWSKYKLKVVVEIEVKSTLPSVQDVIKDLENNSTYVFEDTENVKILDTEWGEIKRSF